MSRAGEKVCKRAGVAGASGSLSHSLPFPRARLFNRRGAEAQSEKVGRVSPCAPSSIANQKSKIENPLGTRPHPAGGWGRKRSLGLELLNRRMPQLFYHTAPRKKTSVNALRRFGGYSGPHPACIVRAAQCTALHQGILQSTQPVVVPFFAHTLEGGRRIADFRFSIFDLGRNFR